MRFVRAIFNRRRPSAVVPFDLSRLSPALLRDVGVREEELGERFAFSLAQNHPESDMIAPAQLRRFG